MGKSAISEAAQNFRLNIENLRNAFVPQFAYETVEIADDVVKNADEVSQLNRVANKIDEFVEARRANISPSIDDSFKQLNTIVKQVDLPNGTWELKPTERGTIFDQVLKEKRGGLELPHNFPVIDGFEDGVATSVKSRDLIKAKTYQDSNKLFNTVKKDIDKLSDFDGQKWGDINNLVKHVNVCWILLFLILNCLILR